MSRTVRVLVTALLGVLVASLCALAVTAPAQASTSPCRTFSIREAFCASHVIEPIVPGMNRNRYV